MLCPTNMNNIIKINTMPVNYLFVKYRTKNKRPEFGEIKGQVIEITPPRQGEENRGSKEGDWLGFTRMPVDRDLWNRLLAGINTVDAEKSTPKKIAVSNDVDTFRIEATKYISSSADEWNKSPYFQKPANEVVYSEYVKSFLAEFTRITKHIPTSQSVNYYPHAWLFPSLSRVLVGRDGVAIVFDYPERPDTSEVIIDNAKILDTLLLPHPENRSYTSNGPSRLTQFICDDEHFVRIVGDGSFVDRSELGNPSFVIFDKRFHSFWENMGISRGYGDGTYTKKPFQFIEIFGDITENNFTIEKAKSRARIYAEKWIANKLSDGKIDNVSKLRQLVEEFKNLASNEGIKEPDIERFIDEYPWIIERGLGYKRYYSQITIDEKLLSRSDHDIRPDKFLERNDGYCDVLDLKRPDAPIIVKKLNRTHASSKLTEAEAQVDSYVNFIKEPKVREELKKRGIKVLSPKGIVLMGRSPKSDSDSWEDVKNRLSVGAFTYDDIINELETIISWVDEILKNYE